MFALDDKPWEQLEVGESWFGPLMYYNAQQGRWKVTKTRETEDEVDYNWEWEVVEYKTLS